MELNNIRVILIELLFFVVVKSQRKETSTVSFAPFRYPTSSYYPTSHVSPYQHPYNFAYAPISSSAAPYPFLYPPQFQYPNASAYPQGLSAQQQYYLGPMNAAQAQYLTAHIQKLIQYARNPPSAPQVQIPSTPTPNASIIQPTPPTIDVLVNGTANVSESSAVGVNTTSINLLPASDPINSTDQVSDKKSSDANNNTDQFLDTNSSDPIVGAAQFQANPFVSSPSYTIGDWLYNPFASMYANFPSRQPFYPPGYGPWNPFVLNPAMLPVSPQSNATQQLDSAKMVTQTGQESSSAATPTIISSTGDGSTTDIENLPPQVKEFIDMIPDILSMPETSQLNPSTNNAIIHQLGGGLENVTPSPRFSKPKSSLRFKKKHFRPSLRRRGNYM